LTKLVSQLIKHGLWNIIGYKTYLQMNAVVGSMDIGSSKVMAVTTVVNQAITTHTLTQNLSSYGLTDQPGHTL
jgi:hypothetical protein